MNPEAWTALGVFAATQISVWIGIIATLRSDTRAMKSEMLEMKGEIKKISDVLVTLAKVDGRLDIMEERHLLTGKRLDDLANRVNHLRDRFDVVNSLPKTSHS